MGPWSAGSGKGGSLFDECNDQVDSVLPADGWRPGAPAGNLSAGALSTQDEPDEDEVSGLGAALHVTGKHRSCGTSGRRDLCEIAHVLARGPSMAARPATVAFEGRLAGEIYQARV